MKRYTSIKRKRDKPRRGEPTQEEIDAARLAVYERAEGLCELHLGPKCIKGVLSFTGDTPWDHGHFVHIKSKGAGGRYTPENGYWGCYECHLGYHHTSGIPLPSHPRTNNTSSEVR
jgi:hypothetical protein